MKNHSWALFDFCETLVDFQTADAYVEYVEKRASLPNRKFARKLQAFFKNTKLLFIMSIIFPKASINKRLVLLRLKGLRVDVAESLAKDFYEERIKPKLIEKIVSELQTLQKAEYNIAIVSGGYGIYLKYFCEDFNIRYLVSSEIEEKEGRLTGHIKGKDCLWENKIWYLKQHEIYNDIIKSDNSVSYSDSKSDIPLLKCTKQGFVVSKSSSKEWHRQYNLKEIIW